VILSPSPGGAKERVGQRAAAVRGRLELIELLGLLVPPVASRPQHLGETYVRGVDVKEHGRRGARVAKGVNDVRGRGGERSRRAGHSRHLRPQPELELAVEDVERVRVAPVDVRLRSFLPGLVAKPRQRQLITVGEDPDRPFRPVEDRLALVGLKENRRFCIAFHARPAYV
jgi:hypothetical protein